jgi:aldoxime dehydratase
MESSIPAHLQCPRTRERHVGDDYTPPFPAWSARAPKAGQQLVMGLFGVQSKGPSAQGPACAGLRHIVAGFGTTDGPVHHDVTHYVDEHGYDNMVAIAYWPNRASFEQWSGQPHLEVWWNSPERLSDGFGWFREIILPTEERYETVFSSPGRLEGGAVAMGEVSGEIQEHAYWGSMRDRFALSQTDAMSSSGELTIAAGEPGLGNRVRIEGHANLAMIRSGQEWTETEDTERRLYCADIEPVLRAGMDFLRDQGGAVGCYTNRYMRHLDPTGKPLEKTFGLSYWRSLSHLEQWSESHPTHVAIFGTFMRVVQELNFQLKLRLYHEVAVLSSDQQRYEYINCHARTGLLNGL